jgi:hypothetical protein
LDENNWNEVYLRDKRFSFIIYKDSKKIFPRQKLFEKFIKNNSFRYDLIIHMVTAANGLEEYYTLKNNNSRTETAQEAVEIDNSLMNAWKGHSR